MSGIPLLMCKRCQQLPGTMKGYCEACYAEEEAAKKMEGIIGNQEQTNLESPGHGFEQSNLENFDMSSSEQSHLN